MALFGGPRAIWIEPAGDDIAAGVAALLDAPAVESVVVAIGGALKKSGALLKLVDAHKAALSLRLLRARGPRRGADGDRAGPRRRTDDRPALAGRIADETGGNQAIAAGEIAKYALFLDCAPDRPRTLTDEVVDLLGCGSEGNNQRLGDLALDGDVAALLEEIERSGLAAKDGVTVLRALQRRLMTVIPLRARIAGGESASGVMTSAGRAIFWKDQELVKRLLRIWPPERLARLVERSAEVEKALMLSDAPEVASVGEHLIAIGRWRSATLKPSGRAQREHCEAWSNSAKRPRSAGRPRADPGSTSRITRYGSLR